jgi:hypothetical protein
MAQARPQPYQPAGKSSASWHGIVDADDPSEPVPTELNTVDLPRYLAVGKDKLTVRYVGRGNHSQDVGSVRTDWPCPQRCLVYYYEVTVQDSGSRGLIAVGMADSAFPLTRQPGWEPNSYSYAGYDGRRYFDSERGEPYGPCFGAGDVVGCGLLCGSREIFFTKNGAHLGVAFSDVAIGLYPTIGMHSPAERVSFNFGAAPFAFDIASVVRSQRDARIAAVLERPLPAVSVEALVRDYLLHAGYGQTLAALEAGARTKADDGTAAEAPNTARFGMPPPPLPLRPLGVVQAVCAAAAAAADVASAAGAGDDGAERAISPEDDGAHLDSGVRGGGAGGAGGGGGGDDDGIDGIDGSVAAAAMRRTLGLRRELCELVLRGEVVGASELAEQHYPGLLARHPPLAFRMHAQQFIELVRAGDAMGAIVYAQQHLSAYRPPQPSTQPAAAKPADSEEGSALSSSCGFCPNTSCTGAASPSATAAFGSNVNCETLTVNTGTAAFGPNGTPSEATGEGAIPGGSARPAGYGEEVEALLCLLAFDHPSKSSARAAQLLSLEHLEATADCLNSAVAEELGAAPTCAIERLLRQLVAVSDALREVNLGQGECMHLTPCSRPQHRADDVGALDDGSR